MEKFLSNRLNSYNFLCRVDENPSVFKFLEANTDIFSTSLENDVSQRELQRVVDNASRNIELGIELAEKIKCESQH